MLLPYEALDAEADDAPLLVALLAGLVVGRTLVILVKLFAELLALLGLSDLIVVLQGVVRGVRE